MSGWKTVPLNKLYNKIMEGRGSEGRKAPGLVDHKEALPRPYSRHRRARLGPSAGAHGLRVPGSARKPTVRESSFQTQ